MLQKTRWLDKAYQYNIAYFLIDNKLFYYVHKLTFILL